MRPFSVPFMAESIEWAQTTFQSCAEACIFPLAKYIPLSLNAM